MKKLFTLLVCMAFVISSEAQFLNRIVKEAKDKVVQKVEDRIIDELTDELARQMYKPIDKALDSLLYREYKASEGRDSIDFSVFLSNLDASNKLPESYSFDVTMEIETKDYSGEKHYMEMMFTKSGDQFAFKQIDKDEDALQYMVIDYKNNIMAIYIDRDGKKQVQAIPSMLGMTQSVVLENLPDYEIKKTGKTKKVAGYECDHYEMSSEKEDIELYATKDFPIDWSESFGKHMAEFNSETYGKLNNTIEGMVLRSESKLKEDSKKKSYWKTKKVNEKGLTINNSDYEKTGLAEME